ncbi:MAG: type II toxin-antitoxin system HipA family toxin [Methylophilaceae bacterium]
MSEAKKLDIYRDHQLVGTLFNEEPIKFVYSPSYKDKGLSPNLPLSEAVHSGLAVESYFENLLPESTIRDVLKLMHQVTTTFGLLSVIGGDTASDLTILPEGETPQPSQSKPITWQDVADEFAQEQGVIQEIREEDGVRISLAGAQRKLSICIDANGDPQLPLGNSPSTYILKPDIKGIEGVWASAINETFVMTLADAVSLGVAKVSYQSTAKACMIKRYDRIEDTNGSIKRLHQLDLCQLDGKPSTIKYESDGGPTLLRCRELLNENGVIAADMKRFIQWIFFNLYVGNNDSHAKNISIYFPPNEGVRITPFYDLISTSLYPGLSRKFAFKIGDENIPSKITKDHIITMSKSLGFKPKYVQKTAEEISNLLLATLEKTTGEINEMAAPGTERTMVERLSQHIHSNTRRAQNSLFTN